jgi:hypothetical protein
MSLTLADHFIASAPGSKEWQLKEYRPTAGVASPNPGLAGALVGKLMCGQRMKFPSQYGGKSNCSMQARTPARMAVLMAKMLWHVDLVMQYAHDGDGFRRLLVENNVRADWNGIKAGDKFVALAAQLGMYAQSVAHILDIA